MTKYTYEIIKEKQLLKFMAVDAGHRGNEFTLNLCGVEFTKLTDLNEVNCTILGTTFAVRIYVQHNSMILVIDMYNMRTSLVFDIQESTHPDSLGFAVLILI